MTCPASARRTAERLRGVVPLLALLLLAGAAGGQGLVEQRDRLLLGEPAGRPLAGEDLARMTEEVTSLMRCPVCQGLSVADSHTPSALAMRAKAEALLAEGYSGEQVLTYFESSYGEFIRLAPRAEGFNLVVWVLPVLALLVGLGVVWMRIRRGRSESPRETTVEQGLEDYRRRVRQDLGAESRTGETTSGDAT